MQVTQLGHALLGLGLKAQDTSELFFDNVTVPPENLLGNEEGNGFAQLMQQLPQERLSLAIGADGQASETLSVIGPVTRGTFWESVAVPDIRGAGPRAKRELRRSWPSPAPPCRR